MFLESMFNLFKEYSDDQARDDHGMWTAGGGAGGGAGGKDKSVHEVLTSRGYEKTGELHGDEEQGTDRTYEHPKTGDVVMHNTKSGWSHGKVSGTSAGSLAKHLEW